MLGTVVVLHLMLSRTTWGRHVYAVGGNAEAARRAGINVVWVKMSCFIMCGVVACLAGMALGSQLNSVSPQTGGNDTLLRAVGAAAIGGVSLFGGRGKLLYPVVGGLVVATIDNGLGLMGEGRPGSTSPQSGPKFIVAGPRPAPRGVRRRALPQARRRDCLIQAPGAPADAGAPGLLLCP